MAITGGVVRRFLSTSILSSELIAPAVSVHSITKPAPSRTLFVVGLNKKTTSETLHETFSKFGKVEQARVVTDHASGYSKGYGFVTYETLEDAAKGIEGMDAQHLDQWIIFVEYALPKTPPGQSTSKRTDRHTRW